MHKPEKESIKQQRGALKPKVRELVSSSKAVMGAGRKDSKALRVLKKVIKPPTVSMEDTAPAQASASARPIEGSCGDAWAVGIGVRSLGVKALSLCNRDCFFALATPRIKAVHNTEPRWQKSSIYPLYPVTLAAYPKMKIGPEVWQRGASATASSWGVPRLSISLKAIAPAG